MKNRELAICLDILGGGQLDCALTEHIDYICERCLCDKWTIMVKGEPIACYDFPNKTWTLGERLRAALLGMGLMNEREEFIEGRARELHLDFDNEWGTPSKPEEVGWEIPDMKKRD